MLSNMNRHTPFKEEEQSKEEKKAMEKQFL
jgi:hypothetical protein